MHHRQFNLGRHCFLDDKVLIYQDVDGGPVVFGDAVEVGRNATIQTGQGGSLLVGSGTRFGQGCQVSAYLGTINIGAEVSIGPMCALYSFNHGTLPGEAIRTQPLSTKGGIGIADGVRLDAGVIVLDGVTIGTGAHVQPRSVVTHDVPEGYVVSGIPARPTE